MPTPRLRSQWACRLSRSCRHTSSSSKWTEEGEAQPTKGPSPERCKGAGIKHVGSLCIAGDTITSLSLLTNFANDRHSFTSSWDGQWLPQTTPPSLRLLALLLSLHLCLQLLGHPAAPLLAGPDRGDPPHPTHPDARPTFTRGWLTASPLPAAPGTCPLEPVVCRRL